MAAVPLSVAVAGDARADNGVLTGITVTPPSLIEGGSAKIAARGGGVCPRREGGITLAIDYGDGTAERLFGAVTLPVEVSHQYKKAGTYIVRLYPNNCGSTGPTTASVSVHPSTAGIAVMPGARGGAIAPPPAMLVPVPGGGGGMPGGEGETVVSKEKPTSVAVDWGNVYYTTSDGKVVKKPLNGDPPTTLATGQASPTSLVAYTDGAGAPNLYWANRGACSGASDGAIMSSPSAMAQPSAIASGQPCPRGIVAANARIYWVILADGSVRWTDSHGGATVNTVTTGQKEPGALAVDANAIYWVAMGTPALMSVSPYGGAPTVYQSLRYNSPSIASDGDSVYYLDAQNLMRVPRDGSGPKPVVPNLPGGASALTADGTTIYYAMNGEIWKKPASGGATKIVGGQGQVTNLAINGTHVFWASWMNGVIKRAPK